MFVRRRRHLSDSHHTFIPFCGKLIPGWRNNNPTITGINCQLVNDTGLLQSSLLSDWPDGYSSDTLDIGAIGAGIKCFGYLPRNPPAILRLIKRSRRI